MDAALDAFTNPDRRDPHHNIWEPLDDHLKAGGGRRALLEAALAVVAADDVNGKRALRVVSRLLRTKGRGSPEALRRAALDVLAAKVGTYGDGDIRDSLACPLSLTDLPEAAAPLMTLAEDRSWRASRDALQYLAELASPHPEQLETITPYLVARLETELVKMAWTHDGPAESLVRALGQTQDRRVLPVLRKALDRHPDSLADECGDAARRLVGPLPRLSQRNPHVLTEADITRAKKLRREALAARKGRTPRIVSSHYQPRSKEMSTDDVAAMFAPASAVHGAGHPVAAMPRPDRKLTPTETAQRDILLSLVRDPHGHNIPIDGQDDEEWLDRAARVEARRVLAADYLTTHIAHDSIVQPLVRFLRHTKGEASRDEPDRLSANAHEAAYAVRSLAATKRVRTHVVEVLAAYASLDAVSALFEMLDDPQVSPHAYARLRQLLEPIMGADRKLLLQPSDAARAGHAPKRSDLAAAEAWWAENGRRAVQIRRAAHNSD